MSRRIIIYWAFFIVCVTCTFAGEPTEAERAVIAYRKSLHTCQVELVSELWRTQNEELTKTSETLYYLKCNEESSRTDRYVSRIGSEGAARPLIGELTIRNGLEVLQRNIDLQNPKLRLAFHIYHIEGPDVWSMVRSKVFDPRVLGLAPVPFPISYATSYSSFVGSENRQDSQEKEVIENGRKLAAVEYTFSGKTTRMKIDPEQGFNLISAELVEGQHRSSISCELSKYPTGDIWFPKTVLYESTTNGVVNVRSVVTVKSARFNEAIDPKVFMLAGLGIEPGTPAAETPPPKSTRVWDGTALVPVQ